jgi:enamine deaminase RidA (YjgF/YER057c/UK114 family)
LKKQLIHVQDFDKLRLPGSGGAVATCIRAGNYVYLTGQTGFTLEGELKGVGDARVQTYQALENIEALMEMAGGSLADVVKIVVYVTDRSLRPSVYPVIGERFGHRYPCSTGLVVKGLAREELLVEIDAWAFIDDEASKKRLVRSHDVGRSALPGTGGQAAQCYRGGNLVYLQGQVGWTLEGDLTHPRDPAGQARQAMENIKALMGMAGGSLSDIVRTVYSTPEREHRRHAYPAIRPYFEGPLPAGTGLIVKGLAREEMLIEVDAFGFIDSPGATKRVIRTHDLGPAGMLGNSGAAIQATRAGNWVFLQGQVGWTLDAELVAVGDAAGQARQAMDNIEALMEMAGGTLRDVARVVVYVTDREVRHRAYPVIRERIGDVWPCGTGVVVKGLAREEMLVEIDAYGFIDDPD